MSSCELMYAEEGRQHIPSSVLRHPVTQHDQLLEHMLAFTIHGWKLSCDRGELGGNWQVIKFGRKWRKEQKAKQKPHKDLEKKQEVRVLGERQCCIRGKKKWWFLDTK